MDEIGNGAGDSGERVRTATTSTQRSIGGVVREAKESKERPSFTKYVGRRVGSGVRGALVAVGLQRPVGPDGELGPRAWKRLAILIGVLVFTVLAWTSVHIVPPGNV